METILSQKNEEKIINIIEFLQEDLQNTLMEIMGNKPTFQENKMNKRDQERLEDDKNRITFKNHYVNLINNAEKEEKNKYIAILFIKQAKIWLMSGNKSKYNMKNIREGIKKGIGRSRINNDIIEKIEKKIDYNLRYIAGRLRGEDKELTTEDKEKRKKIEELNEKINLAKNNNNKNLDNFRDKLKEETKNIEKEKEEKTLLLIQELLELIGLTEKEEIDEKTETQAANSIEKIKEYKKTNEKVAERIKQTTTVILELKEILISYKNNNKFDTKEQLNTLLNQTLEFPQLQKNIEDIRTILYPATPQK